VRTPRAKTSWTLLDAKGQLYQSAAPGTLGAHRRQRIYGRLDCRAAKQAIARGGYVKDRVFFIDERTARAAGYRPCAVCMPAQYRNWKLKNR
jgi:methylphosphotriester-DNA--protein-cysteine methyltransferase